jgi:nucleotide-binding universal stress UspA family protein
MLPKIEKILYATDLLEKGSKNAFRMAVAQAMCHNAQLVILHAMEPITSSAEAMLRNTLSDEQFEDMKKQSFEHLRSELTKRIDDFCQSECPNDDHSYPGGEPIVLVEIGEPGDVILRAAAEYGVDMIVMGTRTHSNIIGQLLLGSTANKVIHHAKVPVTVYPL